MIVIYETHALGKTHVPFNAGLIEIARLAFPEKAVRFYASPSHLAEIKGYVGTEMSGRVDFREIDIPPRAASWLSYAWKSYLSFRRIEQETPQGSLLVFSFIIPASLIAAKIYMRLSRHFCGTQVILHGQLAEIGGWRSRNPFMMLLDFKTSVAALNLKRLRYILLERPIREELIRRMPALAALADVLPHPIPNDPSAECAARLSGESAVTIGYLGLVSAHKGFYIFRDIAKVVKKATADKARFIAIGHTQGKPLPDDIDCLDVKPQTSYLSRNDFTRLIASCHFICLPFSGDHYLFSPSGTLLDAIAAKKPLLALNTPVVKALFDEFGDIGTICDTPEDMEKAIINLVETPDPTRYDKQCQRIGDILTSRTPQHLAAVYRDFTVRIFSPK